MEQHGPNRSSLDERDVSTAAKITLLIADDHAIVRDGIASMISGQGDMKVVAEAANGQEALDQWTRHRPGITLMDLHMPGHDGLWALHQIRKVHPTARIIILTTFDGDEDIYRGLSAGARGYVLKDTRGADLLKYIRDVEAGQTCIPPEVATKLAGRISGPELTEREVQVLQVVASGLSNKEIGASLFISEMTVKSYLKSIFAKLDVASRTEAIAAAARRGIIHLEQG